MSARASPIILLTVGRLPNTPALQRRIVKSTLIHLCLRNYALKNQSSLADNSVPQCESKIIILQSFAGVNKLVHAAVFRITLYELRSYEEIRFHFENEQHKYKQKGERDSIPRLSIISCTR